MTTQAMFYPCPCCDLGGLDEVACASRRAIDAAEARATKAEAALVKINAIRNSIIGIQGFNFSEHAYPLVAALDEAGMIGEPYPEAMANVGTLLERATKAEAENAELRKRVAEMAGGICLRGWWCLPCGVFNGEEQSKRDVCRSCDRAKQARQ